MPTFSIGPETRRVLFWSFIVLLFLIIGSFAVWYIFVLRQQREVDALAAARGFNSEIPAFTGSGGSMRENISGFFQSAFESLTTGEDAPAETSVAKNPTPRLWHANSIPALGISLFGATTATSSGSIRFLERPSGNIFYKSIASGAEPVRITNTLIPFIYDAQWINNDSLIVRHSEDNGITMRTFIGSVVISTTTLASLSTEYLEDGVTAFAIRPDHKEPSLFYLVQSPDGVIGISMESTGKNPKRLWSSPLVGWRVLWLNPDKIVLAQKAAAGIPGNIYTLSPTTKEMSLVIGGLAGLSAVLHPKEDALVYSTSENGVLKLFSRILGVVRELPVITMADKCVWGEGRGLSLYCAVPTSLPKDLLPDAWYRGEVRLSDTWYKIDPVEGTAEVLLDPVNDFDVSIDVIDPLINDSGGTIIFTDARSETPWLLKVAL